MRKYLFVSLCVIGLEVPFPLLAQTSSLATRVDSLFAQWNKPGSPGAAVGVVHGGKLIYAKGFGEADLETGASIGPETIFHVASISKQFTAYAIVLLAQEGKLSLDDDIRAYLPEVPDFGKTITIRHLIHHTSGLRDQWNLLVMAGWQMDDVITKEHILNLVKRQRELNFEPGTEHTYCNTGYTLLAEIVARVTKQPFREWMQQRIFTPLGMKNTQFYDDHERIVKGRAYSFRKKSNTYAKSVLSYANAGATSLFTTVNDLASWVTNFRLPTVGNSATMTQMLERGRLTKGDTLTYAFALQHGTYRGLPYYGHGGADAGFRSYLGYFPTEDYGFIVLSNQAEFSPDAKAFELAGLFMESSLKNLQPVTVSASKPVYSLNPTLFDRYVGTYEMTERPGFFMNYRREGNRYYAQATGQWPLEIFPSSDTTFFFKAIDAQVVFHLPKTGNVTRITHIQNGRHPGNRVVPYEASMLDKEELVGKYFSPELETIYSITLQDDKLNLSHIHHGETRLSFPAKNRLNSSWWFVQNIEVIRDQGNQITGLRMSNGRVRNVWFSRLHGKFDADRLPTATK